MVFDLGGKNKSNN